MIFIHTAKVRLRTLVYVQG